MIWFLVTAALALVLWAKYIRPLDHFTRMGVKQTVPLPFLGDQWFVTLHIMSFTDLTLKIYNTYKKCRYIGFHQFITPALVLRDPELIRQITIKDFDHFTDHRDLVNSELEPIWSGNLFTLKGQRWKEMRSTLSGSFSSSKMKNMFQLIDEAASNFVQHLIDRDEKIFEMELKDSFTKYTNDVIASAAFGIKVDSMDDPNNKFYQMGRRLTNFSSGFLRFKIIMFTLAPGIFKFFKLRIFPLELIAYFRSIINETVQVREEEGIVRKDMINLLMEMRKGITHEEESAAETGFATVKESNYLENYKFKPLKLLTNDDIASQALLFFFAGFDTISTALCFGSYELALNEDIQDQLRGEILRSHEENNGKLTYDSLLKLKYMDNVFSEILRKWPPIPMVDRVCTKPYTIEPKYPDEKPLLLKVGQVLMLPIYALHRNPKYFPNPEKFDPERFSDENKDKIVPYSYLTFGSGPRNCIGSRFAILEAKAVLYYLLLNFQIVPTDKTAIPLKILKGRLQHTAEGGFWLGLKRIKL